MLTGNPRVEDAYPFLSFHLYSVSLLFFLFPWLCGGFLPLSLSFMLGCYSSTLLLPLILLRKVRYLILETDICMCP